MISAPRCPVNWKAGALLGSGAFGEVYVCHDKDTGRDLAMKVVRLEQMNAETSKVYNTLKYCIKSLVKEYFS